MVSLSRASVSEEGHNKTLLEVGKELLQQSSSSKEELLEKLDKLEHLLSMVKQTPPALAQDAFRPAMEALVADGLLWHPDIDVKVSVASCISEIMRISAPDQPYDDTRLEKFFELAVLAFGKLSCLDGPCYSKAVSIIEVLAKCRTYVLMLDLQLDALIVQMFQHFLKGIRFCEGAISAFDPVEEKHQISYDDGDMENLNRKEEMFNFLEDNPSDKKYEADLQCNAVSSVPSLKKKAKRTSSTKKEPGVSSCKRSKKHPRKSDTGSMDIPIPDKMNDTDDVDCEMSSEIKKLVQKENSNITQKQRSKTSQVVLGSSFTLKSPFIRQDLQSNDASSVPSKTKPQKSDVEALDIPIPDKMNNAADVGCETSSEIKELADKGDNNITQKHEPNLQSNDASYAPSTKKKAKRTFLIKKELGVSSSKRSKRKVQTSGIESQDIPIPNKMNDASDGCCEASSGKKLVDNEDDMITKAESRMLDLESSLTPVTLDIVKTKEAKI